MSPPPRPRRFVDQRWAIDNIIAADGIDWDQPRSVYWNAPCGPAASTDFAAIREGVKKLGDIPIEFEKQARRREAVAARAEADGRLVTARENYFYAAVHWGAAQWPIYQVNDRNRYLNGRKRHCYAAYARLADHPVEEVCIPLRDGGELRGWLHLPPGGEGRRHPAVVSIPGMDSFKEAGVALYGDTFLSRGIAVLSVDGPGQWEAVLDGIHLTVDGWQRFGIACVDLLAARLDIDPNRIAVTGRSFGSFAATMAASREPRFKGVAVSATCFEPGFDALCEEACPTFKARLMFMAGYSDELRFDEFRRELDWRGRVGGITAPFLCIGGELDELSAPKNAVELMRALGGERRLVIYEKSRHSVGSGVPSAILGPSVNGLVADWIEDCFAGVPHMSEHWFVDGGGDVHRRPLDEGAPGDGWQE